MLAGVEPLTNADRLFWSVIADAAPPPPPPDYNAWARDNVVFGSESPFPGAFDGARFPFFQRILDVLSPEDPASVVTLQGSSQIGKSVLCQIFVGATLDLDPCQLIYYHPTESNAGEWVKTKWRPFLRGSSALRRVLGDERSRDGSQSLTYYERLDGAGALTVAGSNSGPATSMKSAKVQVQDDLAKWETLPSGDSETQADSRSKAFLWRKIFKVSTPLIWPGCRITRNFRAGTQEHWHVPCRECGVMQPLTWENFVAALDETDPDDAHFTCVGCSARIDHADKAWMNERGAWVAHNPGAREPSFHLWEAYSPLANWTNIALAWLKARGIPSAEQVFFNDTVGREWEAQGESPPFETLRDRAAKTGHKLGHIPYGGLIFTAGADCQKDRVEVHLKAFGISGRRWTVEYRVIPGHISDDGTRAALDRLLAETWPDDYGNLRRLDMLAIDGNAWTDDVLAWVRRHSWNKVIATRGAKSETAPPLVPVQSERRLDGRARKQQRRFYNLGVSALKATLYAALAKDDPQARGYCGYPQGLEDDFFQQLTAERREARRTRDGFTVYRWVKDANQANEVLDTELIAEGAAIRCGWRALTDKTAAELEARLVASGAQGRAGDQPELFDPARPIHAAAQPKDELPPGLKGAPELFRPQTAPQPKQPATPRGRRTIRSSYLG